jgi:hypothetical protein
MSGLAAVQDLPVGRVTLMDEQGLGLRATWHLERGFVNLSMWREDHCSETFRLSIADAARLTGFLVDGLGAATSGLLRAVTNEPTYQQAAGDGSLPANTVSTAIRSGRARLARWIAP